MPQRPESPNFVHAALSMGWMIRRYTNGKRWRIGAYDVEFASEGGQAMVVVNGMQVTQPLPDAPLDEQMAAYVALRCHKASGGRFPTQTKRPLRERPGTKCDAARTRPGLLKGLPSGVDDKFAQQLQALKAARAA